MSSIQLPAPHIAALVCFAVERRDPISYRSDAGQWVKITRDSAPQVAAILAQANANGYAERYRETPAPEIVTASDIRNARRLTGVQAIKAAHSYGYQTSDWSGYETSTAAQIIERIIHAACECLAGYTEADTWVISAPPAPVLRYVIVTD